MIKTLWAAAAVAAFTLPAQAATVVQWTFEAPTTPADLNNSMVSPDVVASTGTGLAMGFHASAATDWSTPAGNGSAESFSSNTWAVGDYYQFSFFTAGFQGLMLSFDQISSGTGPRDFALSYSVDGGSSFTQFTTYSVASTPSWSGGTYQPAHTYSFDMSAVGLLDDQASVIMRLTNSSTVSANGGTVAAGGTNRVDNFSVVMTPVPEAGTGAMLAAGLAALGFLARRRRG